MQEPARILVLRGGALGDFVVTLPVFQALRERWPDARIEVIGYPRSADLALMGGWVDAVHSIDRAGMARFFALQPVFSEEQAAFIRSFHIVLNYLHDPDGSLDANLRSAGARTLLHGSPMVSDLHAVDHFLKPLQGLALYAEGIAPALRKIRPSHLARIPRRIIIHPGSGSPRKNWPIDRYLSIAHALGERAWDVQFLAGEADEALLPALRQAGVALCEDLPLARVVDELETASLYLGNDSGITHLAAASGCAGLALFGPSNARLWAPRGKIRTLLAPGGDLSELSAATVLEELLRVGAEN